MSNNLIPIAVFDLDGTSNSVQSGAAFSRYLFYRGYLSVCDAWKLFVWAIRYTFHLPHDQNIPREVMFSKLKRLSRSQIEALMQEFHDKMLIRSYRPQAIARIQKLKNEGFVVLLVSATFEGIAEVAGAYLDVDDVIATRMEQDDLQRYTGKIDGKAIEGYTKLTSVYEWADSHIGQDKWILAECYGDHHSDEALLNAAQAGYAVCPKSTMKHLAKKNGWNCVDW